MKSPLSDPRQRIEEAVGSEDPPYILPGLLTSGLPVHLLEVVFLRLIPVSLRPRGAIMHGQGDPLSTLQALLLVYPKERSLRTRSFPTTPIEI